MGQNMGVKKYENIKKVAFYCLLNVVLISVFLGVLFFTFGRFLATFYTKVPTEIDVAYIRLHYLCLPYFLCGIMDVMVGLLRGMGHSVKPMIVSIVGVCGFRILWIYTVFYKLVDFNNINSLHYLYVSYPISWIITFSVHFGIFLYVYKKIKKNYMIPKTV
jgi:Na+-driven multidrug efflux pump